MTAIERDIALSRLRERRVLRLVSLAEYERQRQQIERTWRDAENSRLSQRAE